MGAWRPKTLMILVVVTALIVFLLPINQLTSCQCDDSGPSEKKTRPTFLQAVGKKDLIVYGEKDLNKTLVQLQAFNEGHLEASGRSAGLRAAGWVLDCVTWERKWEVTTADNQLHKFLLDAYQLGDGEGDEKRQHTFQEIFEKKDWPASDPSYSGLQSSGPGAMLKHAQGVMAALHVIITKIKQETGKSQITLLDLPCGDMQWMSKYLVTRNDILYTGADIVPELVAHHKDKFSRLPRTKFIQHDIVRSALNDSYDLILSRDLLQHLWKVDALRALDRMSSSGSGYLLVTTYPDNTDNKEVEKDALGSRKSQYNLELPPFLLEAPLCTSYDWNVEHLGLWTLPLRQKFVTQ